MPLSADLSGRLLASIALTVLNPEFFEATLKKSVAEADPANYLLMNPDRFKIDFPVWFRVTYDGTMMIRGNRVSPFTMHLNTGLAIGSAPVKLAARIHGQCELHCFVEGPNRNWLAEIVRQGRRIGLFHHQAGWEQVIALLEMSDQGPVVLSYSVCDSFPNPSISGCHSEAEQDAWYNLSLDAQWAQAVAGLRKHPEREIKPENQDFFFFNGGETAFDIVKLSSGDPLTWIPEECRLPETETNG
jgi:hypothetical protein